MCVVCAQEEQNYWHAEQELLRWGVLCSVVDLLPHIQIIVSPGIKFKRNSSNPMEHEERAEHVGDIR